MIKIDFHLINLTQTIGDKIYEFKSKGGRILLLGLIAGFIARGQGYIDWTNWGIIWRSLLACLAWDVLTFVIFMIMSSFRMKKYEKEMEELKKQKAKTVDTLASMIHQVKQEQSGDAVKNTDAVDNAFKLDNLKEVQSDELAKMIANDETVHCMALTQGCQYSQCTIECSGEENRYFAVFKTKEDAQAFWSANSKRLSEELYFDKEIKKAQHAAVNFKEFDIFLHTEDSGGLALISDGKIIKMTCREVLEEMAKLELKKTQLMERLTEELSKSKSLSTQELFAQITGNVYAISYNVYDDAGNKRNTYVTMKDKASQKDRVAICRDEQTAEVIWMVTKEKLDASKTAYDGPTLKPMPLTGIRLIAELTARDGFLDGVYFCNNAVDHRSLSLEELRTLIK